MSSTVITVRILSIFLSLLHWVVRFSTSSFKPPTWASSWRSGVSNGLVGLGRVFLLPKWCCLIGLPSNPTKSSWWLEWEWIISVRWRERQRGHLGLGEPVSYSKWQRLQWYLVLCRSVWCSAIIQFLCFRNTLASGINHCSHYPDSWCPLNVQLSTYLGIYKNHKKSVLFSPLPSLPTSG